MCYTERTNDLPIILFTHVPIHPDLLREDWYNQENLINKLGRTEETIDTSVKVMQYLAEEHLFKVFCGGRWHVNAMIDFSGKPRYVAGGLFKEIVEEIAVDSPAEGRRDTAVLLSMGAAVSTTRPAQPLTAIEKDKKPQGGRL